MGATADAGEAEVAAAIPGGAVLELVPPADASPLTAARHAGERFDRGALLEEARADAPLRVLLVHGGLLAPLTPHYAVRDLAAELGAALVIAVPVGSRSVDAARLGVEAARGGGLRVAAVVLTGWPDPPSRAQLDDRALAHELTGVAVLVLGPGEPAPDWDVAEWTAGAGDGAAASDGVPGRVALEPYRAWEGEGPGDPRETPRPRLMDALEAVVAVEGPMLATRAYAVVNRAGGGRKLTSVARAPLASALHWLARDRRVELTSADEVPGQGDDVVRAPDAPQVRVRELGPRDLTEVPLTEISELMRRLRAAHTATRPNELKRAVLDTYGLRRLTARADEYLGAAVDLLGD
ncbi:MAG TPA: AAA family ATPase [Solirubrobacteraceae bacterium]|nr:AAA family ATPase [Solirubrobacteraceae bacterium]